MKHKLLTFALMGALTSTMLFSCKNAEEPMPVIVTDSDKELVEYSISVNVPTEMRTRDVAPEGTVGTDGLYTFNRNINRLWYAVYNDGVYLYDSEMESSPQPTNTDNGKFTVILKFPKNVDKSKLKVFFWAGSKSDKIIINDDDQDNFAVNLNFKNKYVYASTTYMSNSGSFWVNGRIPMLRDSFAGYYSIDDMEGSTDFDLSVFLHRPFAEIHILTDELMTPGVTDQFKDIKQVSIKAGFGYKAPDTQNQQECFEHFVFPTTWHFDEGTVSDFNYKKNELEYSMDSYYFSNSMSGQSPERVIFKDREMDYIYYAYFFAPIEKAPLKKAQCYGSDTIYDKFNLAILRKTVGSGWFANSDLLASINMPEEGFKANNRYVIYNKNSNDAGSAGFFTDNYVLEVVADPAWESDCELEK